MSKAEKIQAELDRQKRKNQSKEANDKRAQKKSFWERMKNGG